MKSRITVSTVTPVYSGADYLSELVDALSRVRETWEADPVFPFRLCEAIFVLDSPIDGSAAVIEGLAAKHSWIKVIMLSRNFGQHPATMAGILASSGDWVLTLDEDMQHDPKHFVELLAMACQEGLDIVYAQPLGPVHHSMFRDGFSRQFKRIMAMATDNRHVPSFNSYRLIRGELARAASRACSHETYFDMALCWFTDGIRSLEFPMSDVRFIRSGKSGYSLARLVDHARRMVVSSRAKVLRLGTFLGAAATVLGFAMAAIVLVRKALRPEAFQVQGWASLFVAVVFFGGVSVLLLSIALEYLTTILLQIQGKPTFFAIDRSKDAEAREYFQTSKG